MKSLRPESPEWEAFCDSVCTFLENPTGLRNKTFEIPEVLTLYVRRGRHLTGEVASNCFDLARIDFQPKYQGLGLYSFLLGYMRQRARASNCALYIENVNIEHRELYERRGFICTNLHEFTPSYYILP